MAGTGGGRGGTWGLGFRVRISDLDLRVRV